jgi:hypothetical protein
MHPSFLLPVNQTLILIFNHTPPHIVIQFLFL